VLSQASTRVKLSLSQTLRLLIIDAVCMSTAEYDTVVKNYNHDLGREGAYTVSLSVIHTYHVNL
jgi:hypothetical protein